MKKIEITDIHMPPSDIKEGVLNNIPKDRMLLNWLINWVEDGLDKNLFNFGDLRSEERRVGKECRL